MLPSMQCSGFSVVCVQLVCLAMPFSIKAWFILCKVEFSTKVTECIHIWITKEYFISAIQSKHQVRNKLFELVNSRSPSLIPK